MRPLATVMQTEKQRVRKPDGPRPLREPPTAPRSLPPDPRRAPSLRRASHAISCTLTPAQDAGSEVPNGRNAIGRNRLRPRGPPRLRGHSSRTRPMRSNHRSCHCGILPPHILRNIADKGSPEQRQRALNTLATDQTMRALRAALGPPTQDGPGRIGAAEPGTATKVISIFDAHNTQNLPGDPVAAGKEDQDGKDARAGLG